MGQSQTKDRDLSSKNQLSNQKGQNSGLCNSVFGFFGEECVPCKPSHPGKQSKKIKQPWRAHIISQFKTFPAEQLAEVLLDFLEKTNTETEDAIFQKDLFWVDLHFSNQAGQYERNPFDYIRNRKSDPLSSLNLPGEEETPRESDNSNDENKKKFLSRNFKVMLETSDILDEKVFKMSHQETWMEKSFDIKIGQEIKPPNINNFDPKSNFESPKGDGKKNKVYDQTQGFNGEPLKLSFDFSKSPLAKKNNSNELTGSSIPSSLRNSLDGYHNNTFVLQYQPNTVEEQTKKGNKEDNFETQKEEELYKALLDYKMITDIIDKHLKHPANTFGRLIGLLEFYFEEKYGSISADGKNAKLLPTEAKERTDEATTSLQQFIRIIYEGINMFYKLDDLKLAKNQSHKLLFSRDNLLNFVTSIIFTSKIHDVIFKLYQLQTFPVEEAYEKNLKRCQKLPPQEFGVSTPYCLNEKTIQALKDKNKIPVLKLDRKKIQKNPFDGLNTNNNPLLSSPKGLSNTSNEYFLEIDITNSECKEPENDIKNLENPYSEAISMMANLERRKSPIHKLKTIVKVAELVSLAVENFYKSLSVQTFKKVDCDQTFFIFIYILAKSQITDVIAHCRIIQNFSTNNILDSISGFYAASLEAGVNYLCGMTFEGAQNDYESYSSKPSGIKSTI